MDTDLARRLIAFMLVYESRERHRSSALGYGPRLSRSLQLRDEARALIDELRKALPEGEVVHALDRPTPGSVGWQPAPRT